jgi:hypothetical protein
MTLTARTSGLAALFLVAALAAAAFGKVPTFKPRTIVPGQSIGGVKIGMSKARATKGWGKPDRCQAGTPIWCQYLAESTLSNGFKVKQPFSGFYLKGGKVVAIEIEFAENAAVDAKVTKLKTSKGIHLGSTMAAARSAYGIGPPSGGEAGLSRATFKAGNRCTLFYAPTPPYTRIEAIQVGICGAGGLG